MYIYRHVPRKFNIAPENVASQKESRLPTMNLSGAMYHYGWSTDPAPLTYPPQKYGFNEALLGETND